MYEEKEKKKYTYIDEVIKQDRIGMRRRVMEEDDPRRISRHLAPVKPQTTRAIHEAIQGLNNNEDSYQL